MMSLDVVMTDYFPSYMIKLILMIGFVLCIYSKEISFSNFFIFKAVLIYSIFNLIIALFFRNENLSIDLFSSIFSLVVPAFIFSFTFKIKSISFLKVFVYAPLFVLILGYIYSLTFGRPIFREEFNSVFRLQGASVPAHYGMICFFGIFSSILLIFCFEKKRVFTYLFLFLNFIILYLTGARTALFCSVFVVILFFLKFSRFPIFFKIFGSFLTILLSLVFLVLQGQRSLVSNDNEELINTSGRTEAWDFFFSKFLENPIYGFGAGNSSQFVRNSDIEFFVTPHNEYLRLLLEGGLVGSFILLLLILPRLFNGIKTKFKSLNKLEYSLFVLYVNVLIFSITDNTFSTFQFYLPFLILINFINYFLRNNYHLFK